MKNKKTLLVLSGLQHDTKKFKDLYFLGHWCFPLEKYGKLKKKNFKIQKHHWTSLPKLKKDAIKLEKYYEEILLQLVPKLNEFNKTRKICPQSLLLKDSVVSFCDDGHQINKRSHAF